MNSLTNNSGQAEPSVESILEKMRRKLAEQSQNEVATPEKGMEPIPFPIEVFPAPIQKFIERVHNSGSKIIDPAAYGMAFLAVMTSAVGRSRVLAIDQGSLVRASIYCAVIGYPASGKTKPISEAMEFTKPFQDRLIEEYNQEVKTHLESLADSKKTKSSKAESTLPTPSTQQTQIKNAVQTPIISEKEKAELIASGVPARFLDDDILAIGQEWTGELPKTRQYQKGYTPSGKDWTDFGEPVLKKYYHRDATPEALVQAVIDYPDRTLYSVDELTKLMRSYTRNSSVDDNLLTLHGGGGVGRTRKGEHAQVWSSAVSIIGGLTPENYFALFTGENAGNGFASRFLKWRIKSYPHTTSRATRVRPNSQEESELSRLKAELTSLLDAVFQIPIPKDSKGEPDLEQIKVYLSEAAYDKWEAWKETNYDPKRNDLPENSPLGWNLDRILYSLKVFLLVFHVFKQAEEGKANEVGMVQPETVERVTILADALMYECERLEQTPVNSTNTADSQKLFAYMERNIENNPDGFTVKKLQGAKILSKQNNAPTIRELLAKLCEQGLLSVKGESSKERYAPLQNPTESANFDESIEEFEDSLTDGL